VGDWARELTTDEDDSLVEAFGNAAFIAKSSEFDGIEIHGHEGYLIDQFSSALWNRRKDKHGGDLEGRMRFALSIIEENEPPRSKLRGIRPIFVMPDLIRHPVLFFLDSGYHRNDETAASGGE